MTAQGGRIVWTIATVLVGASGLAVYLLAPVDTPTKGLMIAGIAIVVNGAAWMLARGSGAKPPWEGLLTALFQEKNADVAEEMGMGWRAFDAKEFEAAADHFDQVLQVEPTRPDALYARGHSRRQLGQNDAALADYSRALSLRPDLISARQARAALYLERGDLDGAIDDFTEVLRQEEHDAATLRQRGIAYARRNEPDAALADLKEAIRLVPTDPVAHMERGKLFEARGDMSHALSDYTEAGRLDPTGPGRAAKAELQQRGAVKG
jgi:tetratricopeptide (TPR) repeat protein